MAETGTVIRLTYMKNLFALLGLLLTVNISAQKYKVTGVASSADGVLANATAVLLTQGDSILTSFNITNNKGEFRMDVKDGDYILQITYLGYATHYEAFTINGADKNLGTVNLEEASEELANVTVQDEAIPVQVKDDTIVYNADAFETQPNAPVEDLLKQLPGVEVDQDGNIKAQGEDVTKVFVDGEEFFGDDPQVATKNLPADIVDKVEVYDKASDFSEFTGIDDGQDYKAINLVLEEGKNVGYFGTVTAGGGIQDQSNLDGEAKEILPYNFKASINRFTKNSQLSFIGLTNNINESGFSFRDYIDFMGGVSNILSSGAGWDPSASGIPIANLLGDGYRTTAAGGLNYNYKFAEETRLNLSYFATYMDNDMRSTLFRETYYTDSIFTSTETDRTNFDNLNHSVNGTFKHEIDSLSDLVLRGSFQLSDSKTTNEFTSYMNNQENVLQTTSDRLSDDKTDYFKWNAQATYRRKFKKPGRFLVLEGRGGTDNTDYVTNLYSLNGFNLYSTTLSFIDTLNQRTDLFANNLNYSAKVGWTEPLGGGKFIDLSYNYSKATNDSEKEVWDIDPWVPQTEIINALLTNSFEKDYEYHIGGAKFMISKKKYNLQLGANVQQANLQGANLTNGFDTTQNFVQVLPSANFNYNISNYSKFSIRYNTNVNEPSLEQLQPILDNSNPLSLYIGNPNLTPEYRHNFVMHYNVFSQFSFTSFMVYLSGSYTDNKITNQQTIDDQFITTTSPVNVDFDKSVNGYISFNTPLKFIKSMITIEGDANYQQSLLFINTVKNTYDRVTTWASLEFDNRNKDVIDVWLGGDITNTVTKYSENAKLDQTFTNYSYYAGFYLEFAKTWAIEAELESTIYGGQSFGDDNEVMILTSSLSKYFANERGQIEFRVFDALNQNVGINQTANANYLEEERVYSLGRFYMLSLTWSLKKFGK